jgi:hypothetical protein
MLAKYGVTRPYKSGILLEKAQQTMLKRHGAKFSMQVPSIVEKHAKSMIENWGRDNFFRGVNAWEMFSNYPLKERGFVSKLETDVANIFLTIFGDDCCSCLTKKHKICHDGKYYSPDLYDQSRNLIIEVNGDFFHANPDVYDASKTFNRGLSFDDVRKCEDDRYDVLKKHSKFTYIIWEFDWKNRRDDIIQMLETIKNACDNNTFVQKEKLLGWQP